MFTQQSWVTSFTPMALDGQFWVVSQTKLRKGMPKNGTSQSTAGREEFMYHVCMLFTRGWHGAPWACDCTGWRWGVQPSLCGEGGCSDPEEEAPERSNTAQTCSQGSPLGFQSASFPLILDIDYVCTYDSCLCLCLMQGLLHSPTWPLVWWASLLKHWPCHRMCRELLTYQSEHSECGSPHFWWYCVQRQIFSWRSFWQMFPWL